MPYLCPSFISRYLETTEKKRKRSFLRNGSLLLKELIASSDGKYNPFRIYSEEELKKATNNYDPNCIFHINTFGKWYKGTIEGRVVPVCKSSWLPVHVKHLTGKWSEMLVNNWRNDAVTDVSISAMLSGHKNVLKLLGCCLETTVPMVVYEYAGNRTLCDRIHTTAGSDSQPLPWKSRLEIAREIAHAIAYLHTAFAKPIIHRKIRPSNILLDQNDVPKLLDFSSSMTIREGETVKVDTYAGSLGYMSADIGFEVNEKVDVHNFGSLLLELLTGKDPREIHELAMGKDYSFPYCEDGLHCLAHHTENYLSCDSIEDIVDSTFFLTEGGGSEQQQQLRQWEAVKELALKCWANPKEERPTMVEVTKQLRQIELS
ncbi:hypothetical protein HS088_TW07G00613 [Tripterygium wilfordii]|uniref:Protein kinase domain-containing protein n=1 Tax=Tripterygium wilfordii TaxID=458696 RepID=A0A7J7DFD3_TRIWF|nr:non-functional pseudokinase ZED1-like [Tripterygium wilfordii]XP_038707655.1 non-functional pseudokinase ZED1-like [Tripterygium wilfordii]KAF5745032.1 hypothetical protein HS088_TW07G00613 [Tripterygium wilfordii]